MTDTSFQRAILTYFILLVGGLVLATGLLVVALRRRESWVRTLLQIVGIGLSGTSLYLLVDLAWPSHRALRGVITGVHAVAGTVVLFRAFRKRKSG